MNLDEIEENNHDYQIFQIFWNLPDKIEHIDGSNDIMDLETITFLGRLNFAYGFEILEEICFYVGILSEFITYVDFAKR